MITTSFSARDRLDGLAALGLLIYLDDSGQLRAKGPTVVISAARPTLLQHKSEIVQELERRAVGMPV